MRGCVNVYLAASSVSFHKCPRCAITKHCRGSASRILELIQRSYTWPGMSTFIKEYTNRCERCARMKPSNLAPPGKLHPLELPDIPWMEVTADFTTDLPLSNGFDSILVVVDCFSKEVEFIPCNKTTTALDTARLYLHNVWKNHGSQQHSIRSRTTVCITSHERLM